MMRTTGHYDGYLDAERVRIDLGALHDRHLARATTRTLLSISSTTRQTRICHWRAQSAAAAKVLAGGAAAAVADQLHRPPLQLAWQ